MESKKNDFNQGVYFILFILAPSSIGYFVNGIFRANIILAILNLVIAISCVLLFFKKKLSFYMLTLSIIAWILFNIFISYNFDISFLLSMAIVLFLVTLRKNGKIGYKILE